jgi:hypothetical protein
MLKDVSRHRRPPPDGDWPEPPLPLAAGERRRIATVLILLALLGLIALVASFLAR